MVMRRRKFGDRAEAADSGKNAQQRKMGPAPSEADPIVRWRQLAAPQGIDICVRIRSVSEIAVFPAPSVATATTETVSPAGTPDGIWTRYGMVVDVSVLLNSVSNVCVIPGPDAVVMTVRSPRLSVAFTLNATKSESGSGT